MIIQNISKIAQNKSQDYTNLYLDFVYLIQDYFNKQVKIYLEELENKTSITKTDFKKKLTDYIKKALVLGFNEKKQKTKNEFNSYGVEAETNFFLNNDYVLEYASTQAGKLISGIDETTQKEISKIIEKGLENGDSAKVLAETIKEKFNQYNGYRAELIAHMEIASAYSYGENKYFDELENNLGTNGWKRSITQKDSHVRPSHKVNEEAGWIARDQVFPGTGTMMAPHGFACRCVDDHSIINPKTGLIESNSFYTDKQVENFNKNFAGFEKILSESDKIAGLTYMLNKQEIFALKYYTGNGFIYLNEGFKSSDTSKTFQNIIPFLFGALNKLPKEENIFYRGTNIQIEELEILKQKDIISFNQFISSSIKKEIAKDFVGNILLKIKGVGIKLGDFSLIPAEKEYIFLPKSLFQVEKIEKKDNIYFITLKQIK